MKVRLTYYKPSGKYYSEAEFEHHGSTIDLIQEVNEALEERRLPGLTGNHSQFFVHVETDGFTKIIMPKLWRKLVQTLWDEGV